MSNRITVGLDGSGAGSAAADRAANEAELRSATLELVHAEDWAPYGPFAAPLPEPRRQWAQDLLPLTRDRLLRAHSTLDITTHSAGGLVASEVLASSAAGADLLVLGSRGLGAVAGFVVGSTGSATIPETETPVVLVRSADGLETTLRELLSPWEQKYPQLVVDARVVIGQPAIQILDAASGAAPVVVVRRIRRPAPGARIGPITHAVMHHATSPVAVVAHD
ncbi:Universal stress protein/MSMEI_3859 [Streptomyces xanthophaeus]|uniref:universal stress protein n=1 Tax=Streptomyces xanthophaeus TaxID=67385 RepID=UPI00233F4114|nr:universal stress protein [Streptomyces xanthophaeus]WCD84768.1 Universal stress protein/MSMEI_3859 [Streptomyces xanthophaeus]